MNEPFRVLIVEDRLADIGLIHDQARQILPECVFEQVETREAFLEALGRFSPDMIISNYRLPAFDGMAVLP